MVRPHKQRSKDCVPTLVFRGTHNLWGCMPSRKTREFHALQITSEGKLSVGLYCKVPRLLDWFVRSLTWFYTCNACPKKMAASSQENMVRQSGLLCWPCIAENGPVSKWVWWHKPSQARPSLALQKITEVPKFCNCECWFTNWFNFHLVSTIL